MGEKIEIDIDKNKFKSELKIDIARDFNLNEKIITKLIDLKTEISLDLLKSEIDNLQKSKILSNNEKESLKQLTEEEKEKLFSVLRGYKELIENNSKNNLELLKNSIQNKTNIDKGDFEKILPKNILTKLENPKSVGDEILGIAFGTANSIYTTTKFLYELGKNIIQAPYHIYLIVSGKAEYKIPENI